MSWVAGWSMGFAAGVWASLAVATVAYYVADQRNGSSCARQHNVYQCERIVTYVPKEAAE